MNNARTACANSHEQRANCGRELTRELRGAPACRLQQHGRPSRLLRPWACLELKGRHGCSPRHVAGSVNEPTSAGSAVRRPCWPASAVAGGRRVGVGGGGQRFSPSGRCRMPCNCLKSRSCDEFASKGSTLERRLLFSDGIENEMEVLTD